MTKEIECCELGKEHLMIDEKEGSSVIQVEYCTAITYCPFCGTRHR